MQSLLNLLFLGLLASLVAAAPSQIQKRGSFKVERVRNANFNGHNGPKQLIKAYSKFNMPIPPALLESMRNGGSSTTTSSNGLTAIEDALTESKAKGTGSTTTATTKGKGNGKGKKKGGAAGAAAGTAAGGATSSNGSTTATGNATAGTGSVTNTPESGDVEYLAPVDIGGQTLNLDFDTGSSDLWVFNTQLKASAQQGHTIYDPTQSSTFKMIQGASFSISYGDGSGAAGNVGTDTVNIGGATVTNQAVELATTVSASFTQDTENNGLLGLAFSTLNTVKPQKQKTFFDNVQDSLAEPVFTADLRKNANGAYEFGKIDTSKFTGDLSWVPVNTSQGFWQFSSESFAVGGGASQAATSGFQAIADTGTTLILADPAVVSAYYGQVTGAVNDAQVGGFTVPCDATLPDLQLDVGGVYTATVKGDDINFAQVQGNTCFGGVQETTAGLGIYGDIFFKSQFVAFNAGNNSLGLAPHA